MTERRISTRPAWKKYLMRLCLVGTGLIAGVLIAEISLRLMHVSYPLPYVPDPYCGSRLRPGMKAEFSAEGTAWVQINQDGFRDRNHSRQKPPGTFRIAVLGDSYAEAFQVSQDETFWAILEKKLQSNLKPGQHKVEVLNFGVSGFGTAQELEMLRHHVWKYEPDLVLLAFTTGNDLSDNSKRLSPDGVRPYYIPQDSTLVLDQSFRQHPYYLDAQTKFSRLKVACINRFRILQLARQKYYLARQPPLPKNPSLELGLDPIYTPPESDAWKEAWNITEQLLLRIRDEVEDLGADFWLVTLSNGVQVNPDQKIRRSALEHVGADDLFYPDRRIEGLAQREGISAIILAPQFQNHADKHQVYLHGFANTRLGTGHWNQNGHRLAATIIAKELSAQFDNSP